MAQTKTDAVVQDRATFPGMQPPAPPERLPRILRVETGLNDERAMTNELFVALLDYHMYASVPWLWRALERALRFDFYLAWRARQLAPEYDMVWAGSEKVALPLTLLGAKKPLVVTVHYPQAPWRAGMLKWLDVARRWQAVGYASPDDREFLVSRLGFSPVRVFPIIGIKIRQFVPIDDPREESILSLGVTKRDYQTLVRALQELPGYDTEIFVSSRFGDSFRGRSPEAIPAWVHFRQSISDQELIAQYQNARFVVVALEETHQGSAGISTILEAGACGKAVIATRTGGTPSYLVDGETGILVPPSDIAALRAAIEKLWTHPELAREMGAKGRRFVQENFDPKKIAEGVRAMLLEVYQESQGRDQ